MEKESKNKEVFKMTAMLLEKERIEYIKEMKEYLEHFNSLDEKAAKRTAKKSLQNAGIITSKGVLTAHYRNNIKLCEESK